jgi:hypothetical protein
MTGKLSDFEIEGVDFVKNVLWQCLFFTFRSKQKKMNFKYENSVIKYCFTLISAFPKGE